jgi:hypothetical protein
MKVLRRIKEVVCMKKLLIIAIVIFLTIPCAFSEDVDLFGLSFDQLMDLRNKINVEIISRPEWKEVKVPSGHWRIGDDIPAGAYCIKAANRSCYLRIWGKDYEDRDSNGGLLFYQVIKTENSIGKIELKKGWLLDIDDAVFLTPPVPLGF